MPAIGDLYQVTFVSRLGAQNGLMVTHWECSFTQGTGATVAQIAAKMDTTFGPLIKALMSSTAEYKGCVVQQLTPAKTDRQAAVGSAGIGTVNGDALPPQVAGLLSVRTGFASRSRRGRKYVPFPGEPDSLAAGQCAANYITRLQSLGTALITEITAGDVLNDSKFKFGVYSKKQNGLVDATQCLARANFATQRRRSALNRGDNPLP